MYNLSVGLGVPLRLFLKHMNFTLQKIYVHSCNIICCVFKKCIWSNVGAEKEVYCLTHCTSVYVITLIGLIIMYDIKHMFAIKLGGPAGALRGASRRALAEGCHGNQHAPNVS